MHAFDISTTSIGNKVRLSPELGPTYIHALDWIWLLYRLKICRTAVKDISANKLRKLIAHMSHGAVISDQDDDFGDISPAPVQDAVNQTRSQRIDKEMLLHLHADEQRALLNLLDEFEDCFRDTPGLCTLVQHEIKTTSDFVPKQPKAYKIPEVLKAEVEKQIEKLIKLDFVERTGSPMTSGMVCVSKPNTSIRICCD